jgi:hypothetical protein
MGSVLGIGGDAGRRLGLPLFHIADESLPNHAMPASATFVPPSAFRFTPEGRRGYLAQSCLSNASRTLAGAFSESKGPGLGPIQLHSLQPQAVKVPFSSQTKSLAIARRVSHKIAGLARFRIEGSRGGLRNALCPTFTAWQRAEKGPDPPPLASLAKIQS